MSVIKNPKEVRAIFSSAGRKKIAVPAFCTESMMMTEAILEGVLDFGNETGARDLPVCIAVTGKYPPRSQLLNFTFSGDYKFGLDVFFNHIDILAGAGSPYGKLRVMTHLDHAMPDLDGYALEKYADRFSMVMFDASALPLRENMRLTGNYVRKYGDRVVVEGCVDTIGPGGDGGGDGLTSAADAVEFREETGVDLMVVNVGTEHRVTEGKRKYYGARVREIAEQAGPVLVLHGTSCLNRGELHNLAGDGIVKVNLYTALEQAGSEAVARRTIEDLGNILSEKEIRRYIGKGLLGKGYLEKSYAEKVCGGRISPKLSRFSENIRRDVYVGEIKKLVKKYLEYFNYAGWSRS